MNFVQKLLEAGFVEQGQKILLGIRPDRPKRFKLLFTCG